MTGPQARDLVQTVRRHLWLSSTIRLLLLAVITGGILATPWYAGNDPRLDLLWTGSAFAGVAWITLTGLSFRQMRAANQAVAYMASGRLDLAEHQLITAVNQFSFFSQGKLLACHNLAVVAHGQRNYEAAAHLCDGVLKLRRLPTQAIGRISRILLADCRLSLGDAPAAHNALSPLSMRDERMSLSDQMLLLPIELRSRLAVGDIAGAASDLAWKIRRAEQLDSPRAALVHALLAEACRRGGDTRIADFLQRRAELYHDLAELPEAIPGLQKLLSPATSADNI